MAASWKYSKHGLFTKEIFINPNIPTNEAQFLAEMANMGLSESSHKVYQTAIKHLKRCEDEKGVNLALHFDISKTLNYINFFLT